MDSKKQKVCVDLDGVLAEYDGWKGVKAFGKLNFGMKEFMDELHEVAHIIIFTCRCKLPEDHEKEMAEGLSIEERKQLVANWLKEKNIPYDEIYTGQGKPFAKVYVDDRAVELKHVTNEFLANKKMKNAVAMSKIKTLLLEKE